MKADPKNLTWLIRTMVRVACGDEFADELYGKEHVQNTDKNVQNSEARR